MLSAGFQAEDVARHVEGIDLSATIAQQLVGTDGARRPKAAAGNFEACAAVWTCMALSLEVC